MLRLPFTFFLTVLFTASLRAQAPALPPELETNTQRIIQAALESKVAYQRLIELCDTFGPRFSGTTNLELAIDWTLAQMKADGLDNVRGEPVKVPRWIRGAESVELLTPHQESLPMLGLGGSIATPPEGITAPVLVVRSMPELQQRAAEAKDRIVVFNVPYTEYRETVGIRTRGAIEAARVGAIGSLIRSIGPVSLQTPHTGNMSYSNGIPQIPHAALTIEDAERLQRFQDSGIQPTVRIKMSAQTLADTDSRNVIAEITGRERPEEIIVIGGHIDSWDIGQGAQDDGGGCLTAWEAVRILKELGIRPRRTIRVVLWTNEENGLRGARAYADTHKGKLDKHVLAIESDGGTFAPVGFAFTGSEAAKPLIDQYAGKLKSVGATNVSLGASGADIRPLLSAGGVPIMDLLVDRALYFHYHHTAADTVDKVKPEHLNQCVAAMAVMAYLVADAPETLPR